MTFFTVFGLIAFALCVLFAIGQLVMAWWDHRKLRRHLGRMVPFEEYSPFPPRQLKPHIPTSWQPADDDLDDPREGRPRDASPE